VMNRIRSLFNKKGTIPTNISSLPRNESKKNDLSSSSPGRPSKRLDDKPTPPPTPLRNDVPFIIANNDSIVNIHDNQILTTVSTSVRSSTVINESRNKCGYSFGCMPIGPFVSERELLKALDEWAEDTHTDGGGFIILKTRSGLIHPTKTKGARRLLTCDRAGEHKEKANGSRIRNRGTKKCNCTWALWIEESSEGFMVAEPCAKALATLLQRNAPSGTSFHSLHSHDMYLTNDEKNTNPSLRSMSDKESEIAELLSKAGLSSSLIYNFLYSQCKEEGRPVTFTKEDIYNRFFRDKRDLDCTNVLNYLQARYTQNNSLPYDIYLSENGIMERLFFVMNNGISMFESSECKIVLYDTKHGTNRYGFKIGMFVSLDGNGKTQVLAGSVVRCEDTPSFSWVFKSFKLKFGSCPKIVFTDSDPAMAAAILETWPESPHLLCTFHLFKNFYEHVHPLFNQKTKEWSVICNMWWFCCKNSDLSCCISFDESFDKIVSFVSEHGSNGNPMKKELVIQWLEGLKERKKQWAACYTYNYCTLGVHSTVRSEAINSVIASFCKTTSDMTTLIHKLEYMVDNQRFESEAVTLKHYFATLIAPQGIDLRHTYADTLAEKCTTYAAHIIRAQAARAMLYGRKPCHIPTNQSELLQFKEDLGEDAIVVGLLQTDEHLSQGPHWKLEMDYGLNDNGVKLHICSWKNCSCQFYKCWGLPCSHMFTAMIVSSDKVVLDEVVLAQHWIKKELRVSHTMSSSKPTVTDEGATIDMKTIDGRRKVLSVACSQVTDICCKSKGKTNKLLGYLDKFKTMELTTSNEVKAHRKTSPDEGVGTAVDDEKDDEIPISSLGVADPPLRLMSKNTSAPMTLAYKRAGKEKIKEKNAEEKKRRAQSQGLIA